MPRRNPQSKPALSMVRPKVDPAIAEAFVSTAEVAASTEAAPRTAAGVASVLAPPAGSSNVEPAERVEPPKAVRSTIRKGSPKAAGSTVREGSSQRGVLTRASGRKVRRRVVYLPPLLDKKLAVEAAQRGVDVSEIVAELAAKL